MQKAFEKELEIVNKNLGSWEKIKQFRLLEDPWSVDSGELTATLKMKRKAILEKYADIVADIYKDDGSDVFKDVKEDEQPDEEIISQLAS